VSEPRILSLVPSITELVCDLGLADHLVGRTGFCVHPWETVRHVPKVGGTKDLKFEAIRALRPTHVIVNIDENRREDAEALATFVPEVVVTHPLGPRDNLALYRQLGATFDRVERAEELGAQFEDAYRTVTAAQEGRPLERVLYLIWREPWMTVATDTYISQTLRLLNWITQPVQSTERYPEISLESYAGRVDRVLLSSEPFHFKARHIEEVAAALPGAQVSRIDGKMTSWYGSRAIRAMSYLTDHAAFCGRNV
jgi:ABC-type Fe3+-hydroxamate transport system substrate-binding protein